MLPEMRRKKQGLTQEECLDIIARRTHGVLALAGDDGYPYALPLSYVYADGRFYFHSALKGHKIDSIARCDKASFAIIDSDLVQPAEYTTLFRSVIAFGRIRIIEDEVEKLESCKLLGEKYNPGVDQEEVLRTRLAASFAHMHMIMLEVERMDGKESKHFAKARTDASARQD